MSSRIMTANDLIHSNWDGIKYNINSYFLLGNLENSCFKFLFKSYDATWNMPSLSDKFIISPR